MTMIRDRVFAITGAASGIGRALAIEIARRGGHVAVSDISEDVDQTAAECEAHGVEVHHAVFDVSDRDAMFAWAEDVAGAFGRVNAVVNNAGVGLLATVEDMDIDDFRWLMDINFWGVVHGTQAFLPIVRESGEGHVVNISSVFGMIAVPTQSAYNAAKFAVRGFTESLRQEMVMEKAPIAVTCVHPGGIRTNIARSARNEPLSRYDHTVDPAERFDELAKTSPETAATTIIKGIEGNAPRVLIGLDAQFIDKAQRTLPTLYQRVVVQLYRRNMIPK